MRAGKLVKTILEELRDSGILNRGKPFARNTLYRLLANEKYVGVYRHGDEVFTNIYPKIVPEVIFSIVKSKIENNKYGKHKEYVYYLLRNKLKCGYCGKPVNSDAGTSKNGFTMRYYKCSGKRITKDCPLKPVRKEMIEQIVIDATYEAFSASSDFSLVADKILEAHKKRIDDQSIMNILLKEYGDIEHAINNLLNAMEKGIITSSTNDRLDKLEMKKTEISNKLASEKSKIKLLITKEDIELYLHEALRKDAKLMVDRLIKEVILYNDKIEIYYNYTDTKRPDGDSHRVFSFYTCTKSYEIDQHKIGCNSYTLIFEIILYI